MNSDCIMAARSGGENTAEAGSSVSRKTQLLRWPSVVELHVKKDLLTVLYGAIESWIPLVFKGDVTLFDTYPEVFNLVSSKLNELFKCSENGSSAGTEIFAGFIQFCSCLYCLPVIPEQMEDAGYRIENTFAIMCCIVGIGSVASGILTNTPLIIAPPTAISIFLVSGMRDSKLDTIQGNFAVTVAGVFVASVGIFGPVGNLITKLIPSCIQASTTVGIGLLTALAGAREIGLIEQGDFTLLQVGEITHEILIAMSGFAVLSMSVCRGSKISYLVSLLWGTFITWTADRSWPKVWIERPSFKSNELQSERGHEVIGLTFSLVFLLLLTIYGLARALCDLAKITPKDGVIPRGRFLVLIIGICNIASGLMYGPPIAISPETVGGIKAGARTGLSAVVCGVLFLLSIFFGPLFSAVPATGTTPILLMIGLVLFMNISRIDFSEPKYSIPAFCCMFFIAFTNSIVCGVGIGIVIYLILSIFVLDFFSIAKELFDIYFPLESIKGRFSEENIQVDMSPPSNPMVRSQNMTGNAVEESSDDFGEIKQVPSKQSGPRRQRRKYSMFDSGNLRSMVTETNSDTSIAEQLVLA